MVVKNRKIKEVLVVSQGFERGSRGRIGDFTMDDFRGDKLPHFSGLNNFIVSSDCYIEKYDLKSKCLWGYSRWITGENGKLRLLDHNWDSSG